MQVIHQSFQFVRIIGQIRKTKRQKGKYRNQTVALRDMILQSAQRSLAKRSVFSRRAHIHTVHSYHIPHYVSFVSQHQIASHTKATSIARTTSIATLTYRKINKHRHIAVTIAPSHHQQASMKLLFQLIFLCIALLTMPGPAGSEFLRSSGTSSLEELPMRTLQSNDTSSGLGPVDFRCSEADICFNNPGYFNGFRMFKIETVRNLYKCTNVCVPTGACLFSACTPNFFFFTLKLKDLKGWECGKCPQDP